MELTFAKTKEAIKEWERGVALRNILWEEATCTDDVCKATSADHEAGQKVKEAFFEDTKSFNSLGNCLLADIKRLKKLVGWPEQCGEGESR